MQTRSEETRQGILQAASQVFSQAGYGAAIVAEICQAAGVSKGAFYYHYPSKQAVFLALLDKWLANLDAGFSMARSTSASRSDSILLMAELAANILYNAQAQLTLFLEFWLQATPSFNWKANLPQERLADFREKLAAMGYRFQFITLAGWHALNLSMFELARAYKQNGMAAYSEMQQREFANEAHGFRATKHQSFVGTGYFDAVQTALSGGETSTTAMAGSTEAAQFKSASGH